MEWSNPEGLFSFNSKGINAVVYLLVDHVSEEGLSCLDINK